MQNYGTSVQVTGLSILLIKFTEIHFGPTWRYVRCIIKLIRSFSKPSGTYVHLSVTYRQRFFANIQGSDAYHHRPIADVEEAVAYHQS